MQRCPACRARYKGEAVCARCGTDLSLPLRSEQQAMEYLQLAVQHLLNGDQDSSQAALQQALLLKHTPLAVSLGEFLKQTPAETHAPLIHIVTDYQ